MKVFKKNNVEILLFDANRFVLRLRGLIGREINDFKGLMLTPCNQIHTFFMNYPIDAVFLSDENIILHIEENMAPNKIGKKIKNAKKVVELKSGISKQLGLGIGNKINIEETLITG